MFETVQSAALRLHRTATQHGMRSVLSAIGKRLRAGSFSLDPMQEQIVEGTHPFDETVPGLDTAGLIRGGQLATGHRHDLYNTAYYGTAPSLFRGVVERWRATPGTDALETYTFIDMGSGKGRAVMLAAEMSFHECVGVELNPLLHEIACVNKENWDAAGKAASPMRLVCSDATEFVFPSTRCLVYLFNPFTAVVFERLIEAIETAFAHRAGELDLLYVNAEYASLLQAHAGFEKLWEMPVSMSAEDAAADLLYMADASGKKAYGVEGQEPCSAWRWVGTLKSAV